MKQLSSRNTGIVQRCARWKKTKTARVSSQMYLRLAAFVAVVSMSGPCSAEPLRPDAAREFVVGKLFAFNCFEGTRGSGRIYSDGSVAGSIQLRGAGEPRYVTLPPSTLQVKGESYCASVAGIPFEPCFEVDRLNVEKFRGSLLGVRWAFCEFTKGSEPPATVDRARTARSSKPLSLAPPLMATRAN